MRTSLRRPKRFQVSRHGVPIDTFAIRHSIQTGIEFGSELFPLWDAAISAGATLDELEKVDQGGYKGKFLAKVMAWKRTRNFVDLHSSDAQASAAEKAAKKKR